MLRCCLFACAVAVLGGGCGLIDSDIADVDLSLPDKTFSIDADQWPLDEASQVPGVDCSGAPQVCASAAAEACPEGECSGACVAGSCQLTLPVAKWRPVDLGNEKPELASIEEQSPLDVTIDAIRYSVTENSLTVDTPAFTLYVAPMTVMTPEGAEAIGTIPSVPANTLVSPTEVQLTAAGRAALEARMADFRTPFNIIVGAEIVIGPGDTVPSGRITANVAVEAHAGL
jgi:hypothetical protein